jgi:hypothetical protein
MSHGPLFRRRFLKIACSVAAFVCAAACGNSYAAMHRASVPLQNGQISVVLLSKCLATELHLPPGPLNHLPVDARFDLRGIEGASVVRGLNQALGEGFHLTLQPDALVINFDPDQMPGNLDGVCDALIQFTSAAAPQAIARQNLRLGLFLPKTLDSSKPLVILIHGMDGDATSCSAIGQLLQSEGLQTGYFAYPAEQHLDQSATSLTRALADLHQDYPRLRINLVTESMGGLIARRYIEGSDYSGSVDHFILIAPPNGGSTWAKYSVLNKIAVDANNYWRDPEWSFAWAITEGMCQAGRDMKPGSKFLMELNARPRREGVRYTIIAGDRPIRYRLEAGALATTGRLIGGKLATYWGFRQIHAGLETEAVALLNSPGKNDGPVTLQSARLAGVSDFVAVTADHISLYESVNGRPPAAWPIIESRLRN